MHTRELKHVTAYHKVLKTRIFWESNLLTFLAGFVNSFFLSYFAIPVSHMTGAVARFGQDIAQGNMADLQLIFGILIAYLVGSVVCGISLSSDIKKLTKRYPLVLALEGVALAVAVMVVAKDNSVGILLGAFACGLQNAITSSYYGFLIRSTHMTGIFTDLGLLLGQKLKGGDIETWKILLLSAQIFSFCAGAYFTIKILS